MVRTDILDYIQETFQSADKYIKHNRELPNLFQTILEDRSIEKLFSQKGLPDEFIQTINSDIQATIKEYIDKLDNISKLTNRFEIPKERQVVFVDFIFILELNILSSLMTKAQDSTLYLHVLISHNFEGYYDGDFLFDMGYINLDPFLSYIIENPSDFKVSDTIDYFLEYFDQENYYTFNSSLARQFLNNFSLTKRNTHLMLALLYKLADTELIKKFYFDLENWNRLVIISILTCTIFLGQLLLHENDFELIQNIKLRLQQLK